MTYDLQTTAGAVPCIHENGNSISFPSSLATSTSITWPRPTFEILEGDVRELLPHIPQVHSVVTSPPYFQQRVYGDMPEREVGRGNDVDDYINDLVGIFAVINLHPQGSVWVNIGDKRDKLGNLLCIPERFVIGMAKAGFGLIDRVTWAKSEVYEDGTTIGNHMPEPCKGRLNEKAQEPVYRFTKSRQAWTDILAVQIHRENVQSVRYLPADLMSVDSALNGRRLPNVWNIKPGQTSEKHHAVYPAALCERPVAMTCPPFVNPDGSLPRRLVEMSEYDEGHGRRGTGRSDTTLSAEKTGRRDTGRRYVPRMPISRGWESITEGVTSGVVFDPFVGTGTTGEVALKMGRSFIGVDLYSEYVEIARRRCADAVKYVETRYGYDRIYEMITVDQSVATISMRSTHRGHFAPLFEEQDRSINI